jgi:tripartite-type tricarboxylate transporter receptor subunit TctC
VSNSTRGIAGPAGIPAPVVAKLADILGKAMADPDHIKKMEAAGLALKVMSGDEYKKYYADTHERAKQLMDWAKSRPQ